MLRAAIRALAADAPGESSPLSRHVRRYILLALIALSIGAAHWVVFVGAVTLSLAVGDDARIEAHLRDAVANGTLSPNDYPFSPYEDRLHSYDMFTECVALGLNLSSQEDDLLRRAARSQYVITTANRDEMQACPDLLGALEAGSANADAGYLRFWHGYQVFLRPLLTVTSLENVRRIAGILLYGGLVFFTLGLSKWFGPWTWPIVLVPLFLLGDFFTMPMVTSHAIYIGWILFTAGLATFALDLGVRWRGVAVAGLALTAGAVTNFIGFLISPALALALLGFLVIASEHRRPSRRSVWSTLLFAATIMIVWYLGYVGAWIEKWAFAAFVLGQETVVTELTSTTSGYLTSWIMRDVWPLQTSLRILFQLPPFVFHPLFPVYMLATWAGAALLLVVSFARRRLSIRDLTDFALLMLPLLTLILWVELARAHSFFHGGFVYRSFLVFSILPMLAALHVTRLARSGGAAAHRTA
jgi:hypothetical protein